MLDWFTDNTLNCLYGVALSIGLLYSMLLLVFDGLDDIFGGLDDFLNVFDVDVDAADGADIGISMLAIAVFVSAFGAFGLASRSLIDAGVAASIIIASTGGFVFGGLAQAFFIYILSPTTNAMVLQETLQGQVAEVTIPIPENGTGQVMLVAQGSRVTYGARAYDNQPITRGTEVRIEKIIGSVATVIPTSEYELN